MRGKGTENGRKPVWALLPGRALDPKGARGRIGQVGYLRACATAPLEDGFHADCAECSMAVQVVRKEGAVGRVQKKEGAVRLWGLLAGISLASEGAEGKAGWGCRNPSRVDTKAKPCPRSFLTWSGLAKTFTGVHSYLTFA